MCCVLNFAEKDTKMSLIYNIFRLVYSFINLYRIIDCGSVWKSLHYFLITIAFSADSSLLPSSSFLTWNKCYVPGWHRSDPAKSNISWDSQSLSFHWTLPWSAWWGAAYAPLRSGWSARAKGKFHGGQAGASNSANKCSSSCPLHQTSFSDFILVLWTKCPRME